MARVRRGTIRLRRTPDRCSELMIVQVSQRLPVELELASLLVHQIPLWNLQMLLFTVDLVQLRRVPEDTCVGPYNGSYGALSSACLWAIESREHGSRLIADDYQQGCQALIPGSRKSAPSREEGGATSYCWVTRSRRS